MYSNNFLTFASVHCILFCCLNFRGSYGYIVAPIVAPLKDVTFPVIIDYFQDLLKNAVLPFDTQDAVAIFISEGVSGALGGLAAKAVMVIDGNKNNRLSGLINAEVSGAYFGVTGAIRSLAQISGLSPIAINLLALFLATIVSEGLKFRSRSIVPQRKKAVESGPTMYDLMKFKKPSMFDLMKFRKNSALITEPRMPMVGKFTANELRSDIVRWLIVYSLLPSNTQLVELDEAVAIGAVSGLISQLVRESDDKELATLSANIENSNRKPWDRSRKAKADFPLTRFARSTIEGAFQLFAYEAARDYVYAISPVFQNSVDKMSMEQSAELSPLSALTSTILNLLKEIYSGSYNINTLVSGMHFGSFFVGSSNQLNIDMDIISTSIVQELELTTLHLLGDLDVTQILNSIF